MERPSIDTLTALKEQYNVGTQAAMALWKSRKEEADLYAGCLQKARDHFGATDLPDIQDLRSIDETCFGSIKWIAQKGSGNKENERVKEKDVDMKEAFLGIYCLHYSNSQKRPKNVRQAAAFMNSVVEFLSFQGFEPAGIKRLLTEEENERIVVGCVRNINAGRRHFQDQALVMIDRFTDGWYERGCEEGTLDNQEYQRLYLARHIEEGRLESLEELEEIVSNEELDAEIEAQFGIDEQVTQKGNYLKKIVRQNRSWLEKYFRG